MEILSADNLQKFKKLHDRKISRDGAQCMYCTVQISNYRTNFAGGTIQQDWDMQYWGSQQSANYNLFSLRDRCYISNIQACYHIVLVDTAVFLKQSSSQES